MMGMRRRAVLSGVLILGLALTLTLVFPGGFNKAIGESQKPAGVKPVLRVGYLPITHSLPLVVADKLDRAAYRNFSLELVPFSSWPELTEALNGGKIQAAITMFELAIVSQKRGVPIQVLALSHTNGDALVVAKRIAKLEDLKGKTVAIPHRLSGHNILLYKALKDKGINYDEVGKLEMAPPDMPAALARGEVAGYIVAEPFGSQAVVGGQGKVLLRAQEIWPDWICCGLVINERFAEGNSAAVQELVNSLVKAGKFIQKNHREAIKIAQQYMKIKPELWELSLGWIDYGDLTPKPEEFNRLQNYLLELPWNGRRGVLLGSKVDIHKLVNPVYVEKAYQANQKVK